MYTQCAGHLGRIAGPVLSAHQKGTEFSLLANERRLLQLLRVLVDQFRPRDILVVGPQKPPFRIYSDASFENGELRLGWVLLWVGWYYTSTPTSDR